MTASKLRKHICFKFLKYFSQIILFNIFKVLLVYLLLVLQWKLWICHNVFRFLCVSISSCTSIWYVLVACDAVSTLACLYICIYIFVYTYLYLCLYLFIYIYVFE